MAHFGFKVPKSQAAEKTPYTIYYPHNLSPALRPGPGQYWQIAAIDPGLRNLGIRIERRYRGSSKRETIYMNSFMVEKIVEEEGVTVQRTFDVITSVLDSILSHLLDCHYLLIERQLPQNYKVSRIAQHILSYLLLRLYHSPCLPGIIEMDPKLKGKLLGSPKGISERELKKWAIVKAEELLSERDDQYGLSLLHQVKKKDEFGDTICMIEAIAQLWRLDDL